MVAVPSLGAHIFVTPTREPPMPTAMQRGDPLRSPRETGTATTGQCLGILPAKHMWII
jgi:hypothetical protein